MFQLVERYSSLLPAALFLRYLLQQRVFLASNLKFFPALAGGINYFLRAVELIYSAKMKLIYFAHERDYFASHALAGESLVN